MHVKPSLTLWTYLRADVLLNHIASAVPHDPLLALLVLDAPADGVDILVPRSEHDLNLLNLIE